MSFIRFYRCVSNIVIFTLRNFYLLRIFCIECSNIRLIIIDISRVKTVKCSKFLQQFFVGINFNSNLNLNPFNQKIVKL